MGDVHINVISLFPELFGAFTETSFVKKAIEGGQLSVHLEPLRSYGLGKHLSVDDTPYGGGSGMVMRVDCLVAAIESVEARHLPAHRVLLTPQGAPLTQSKVLELARLERLTLVCGRYEGFDDRVRSYMHEELSLGDYVLTGGEVPAMAVIEAIVRLLPGVLGNEASTGEESFSPARGGLLEYPQYTRPSVFRGAEVPAVLRGGDHGAIARWRRDQALQRTRERRPDLLRKDHKEGS